MVSFSLAVFTAAALLFWIQPLASRMLLPALGGSPLVWNTTLVFFQAMLLGGYGLAHLLTTHVPGRRQLLFLLPLWALTVAILVTYGPNPFNGLAPPDLATAHAWYPAVWILQTLAVRIGPACLAVCMMAPLLSAWSATRGPGDPYPLYAVSNSGAVFVLVAYPFLFEPLSTLSSQLTAWHVLFVIFFAALGLLCPPTPARLPHARSTPQPDRQPLPWARILLLAALPSALLLATTQRMTTNLPAVPFLWLLPLAVFLGTYVFAFSRSQPFHRIREPLIGRLLPLTLTLTVLFQTLVSIHGGAGDSLVINVLYPTLLGLVSLAAHGLLSTLKPHPSRLTQFYLLIALGGASATLGLTFIAPLLFNDLHEYPLLLVAACLLPLATGTRPQAPKTTIPYLAAAAAGLVIYTVNDQTLDHILPETLLNVLFPIAILATAPFLARLTSIPAVHAAVLTLLISFTVLTDKRDILHQDRTFFGVHQVIRTPTTPNGTLTTFVHSGTVHGGDWQPEHAPATSNTYYYGPGSPFETVMNALVRSRRGQPLQIALGGLGIGSILCFLGPHDHVHAYEVDPAVHRLARRHFRPLTECPPTTTVHIGDARLGMARTANHAFDAVILDVFTSGTIPVHLLTVDAFATYKRILAQDGIIVVHISNRYLDLEALLEGIARDGNLRLATRSHVPEPPPDGQAPDHPPLQSSHLAVLARTQETLDRLAPAGFTARHASKATPKPWTDDFASLFTYLKP